jgi:hypothetical protein
MTNPWDPRPFPKGGDPFDAKTYEGVGRVLSRWEAVEFQLARIYSIFVGDPDGDAIQQYGLGRIFRERLEALQAVSQPYFVRKPSQALEAGLDCLGKAATGFADRRNEVAHGMVFPVHELSFFRERFGTPPEMPHYLLLPPWYAVRKHYEGTPLYAYGFDELWSLMVKLLTLSEQLGKYRLKLLTP